MITFEEILPGDLVTLFVPNGVGSAEYKEKNGRATICAQRTHGTVILNMGGRHGLPGVTTKDNFVKATRRTT